MGTWLVSEKIQKETKRKQRLSLGLGAIMPIDHTRARIISRLAEIKAEVMCCMSTATVKHRRHAQSPGSSFPETRVAAHGKRAAPLLARFLLTAQGAGASGLFSQPRVRHGEGNLLKFTRNLFEQVVTDYSIVLFLKFCLFYLSRSSSSPCDDCSTWLWSNPQLNQNFIEC